MYFGEPFGGVISGAFGATLAALLRTGTPLTGRQVHRLSEGGHSLWSVQEALKTLTRLGIIETRTVGRAHTHAINEAHATIAPLRALLDPVAMLESVLRESIDHQVEAVILFGSIARGESTPTSDIDLAVIAPADWNRRAMLEDAVLDRLGNTCQVLVFTAAQLQELAAAGEPVVRDILRDGVVVVGSASTLEGT